MDKRAKILLHYNGANDNNGIHCKSKKVRMRNNVRSCHSNQMLIRMQVSFNLRKILKILTILNLE